MADYKIQTPNGEISIEVPGGWATEATLQSLSSALSKGDKGITKAFKDIQKEFDKNNKRGITGQVRQAADDFEELGDELSRTEKGMKALGAAVKGASEIASGVLQGSGRLTDAIPLVDVAARGFAKTAAKFGAFIPFVGDAVSQFGEAAIEFSRQFINLNLQIGDMIITTFDSLTAQGLQTNKAFFDLTQNVTKAKIGMEVLSDAVTNNAFGLVSLGGDLETGVDRFVKIVGIANNDLRKDFRALGMSTTEVGLFMADFIESQSLGLLQRKIGDRELADTALMLNKELKVLAEITGEDVDALRQKMMADQMAAGFAIQLATAEREGAAGATAAIGLIKAGLPELAGGIDALGKFDSFIGEFASLNMVADGQMINLVNNVVDEIMDPNADLTPDQRTEMANSVVAMVKNMMASEVEAGRTPAAAEFAGIIAGNEHVEMLGTFYKAANEQYARMLNLDTVLEGTGSTDLPEHIRKQQQELNDNITNTDTLIGKINDAIMKIEDARVTFESGILSAVGTTLPTVADSVAGFYGVLSGMVGTGGITTSSDVYVNGADIVITSGGAGLKHGEGPMILEGNQTDGIKNTQDALEFMHPDGLLYKDAKPFQMGGGLFPGMTALVGEAGPELISLGNSFGEVMNSSNTQDLFKQMGGIVETFKKGVTSGDMSGAITNIKAAEPALKDKMGVLQNESSDMQKQAVDFAAKNQQTLIKIEKLLRDLLPKAMSSNGYF
jgi:hypothetical protein